MVKSARISVGCRVSGHFGPLKPNPNESIKRRVRDRVIGTVIRSAEHHKWDVVFDIDGKERKAISSRGLRIESKEGAGIPLHEVQPVDGTVANNTVIQDGGGNKSTNSNQESVSINNFFLFYFNTKLTNLLPLFPSFHAKSDGLAGSNDGGAGEVDDPIFEDALEFDEDVANDVNEETENEDTERRLDDMFDEDDFIPQDGMELNDAARHLNTYHEAWRKIRSMKGQEVECNHDKDGRCVWKIVDSVDDDVFRSVRERQEKLLGSKYVPVINEDNVPNDDYSRTFWTLWAKEVEEDLLKLNQAIKANNITRKKNLQKVIREVTKSEFVIFHALLIGASL